jgi:hypothetical protein
MLRRVVAIMLAAAFAIAVAAPPVAAQYVQVGYSAPAPSQPERKLTPQQEKLKACGAKWQKMKADGSAKNTTWAAFRKECMRAPA